MNFAKFYYNSNSSIQSLQGNVLKSTIEQIYQDKVIINTGAKQDFLCFQHELAKDFSISKWNPFLPGSAVSSIKLKNRKLKQKTFFDSSYYQKINNYSEFKNLGRKEKENIDIIRRNQRPDSSANAPMMSVFSVKGNTRNPAVFSKPFFVKQPFSFKRSNLCLIGIEEKRSKISGEFVFSSPKSVSRLTKRKLIWTELNKLCLLNKKNRISGLILNPVNGGFAVAVAGYIAFLPRSLCVNKKIFAGQWRQFSIISMNPKIANIVIKEIKTENFSETEKKKNKEPKKRRAHQFKTLKH